MNENGENATVSAGSEKTIGKIINEILEPETSKKLRTVFHQISDDSFVSAPMMGLSLIEGFRELDVEGQPLPREPLKRDAEIRNRVKEFIGDISDDDFKALDERVRKNVTFNGESQITHPSQLVDNDVVKSFQRLPKNSRLHTHQVLVGDCERTFRVQHLSVLKYRGDRSALSRSFGWMKAEGEDDLEPGKTVLYYVRICRPNHVSSRMDHVSSRKIRNPVTSQLEIIFHGNQMLSELRDYIKCSNDYGPRNDVSENPDEDYIEYLKEVFPSGLLFINNVFYNDMRNSKSIDYSECIRKWCKDRGIADLAAKNMEGVTFNSLELRLGHPEVYIHQGDCEHMFTFTQVRVLHPADVCVSSYYPINSPISNYKSILCLTCGAFTSQWIVTKNERIPYEPAYMCSTCFKQYNYIDGKKVGEFKAYRNFDKNSTLI